MNLPRYGSAFRHTIGAPSRLVFTGLRLSINFSAFVILIEFVSVVARVRWGGQSRSAVQVVPSILYVTLGFLTHPTEMGHKRCRIV